jgi:midasin
VAVDILSAHPYLFHSIEQYLIDSTEASIDKIEMLVKTAYYLLNFSAFTFQPLFKWTFLYPLLQHSRKNIQIFAAEALSIVLRLSDQQKFEFLKKIHLETEEYGFLPILDLVQSFETQEVRLDVLKSEPLFQLKDFELSERTVNVGGILLPKKASIDAEKLDISITPNVEKVLYSIALAISLKNPILLQGPPGCGKTTMIEALAKMTSHSGNKSRFHA